MTNWLSINPTAFKQHNEAVSLEHDQIALQAVLKVFESWAIPTQVWPDILEGIPAQALTGSGCHLHCRLTSDQRERIAMILNFDKILQNLFLQNKHRLEWIHNKHKSLNGNSPFDVFACGSFIAMYELYQHVRGLRYS